MPYDDTKDWSNWKGKLNGSFHLTDWQKTDYGFECHFYFRREANSILSLKIYKSGDKFRVGFRQNDGRGMLNEELCTALEEAKRSAIEFVAGHFFREGLQFLERHGA